MSQISYRANLSAAIFPLSLASAGRSVIVPGPDNVYDRRVDPEGEQKNAGIPQAIYLENVIPTANGYQSVGYTTHQDLPLTFVDRVDQIYAYYASGVQFLKFTLITKTPGNFYSSSVYGLDYWTPVIFVGAPMYASAKRITSAIVRGVCYVLIYGATSELYIATYDGIDLTLTNISATTNPVNFLQDAIEICGSYNYLVATKATGQVYWSSTTTPTDFLASLVTGAGSASPNGALNRIDNIESHPTGFYLYTPSGMLNAMYTGNSRYPWKFTVVKSTSQPFSFSFGDINSENTFVLETTGTVRTVVGAESNVIASEVSAYIRAIAASDQFNYTTNVLTKTAVAGTVMPKVQLFQDRYIVISCDVLVTTSVYSTILIYDIVLKRYGKLKIPHTDLVFYYSGTPEITANKIGIIDKITGKCSTVNFDVDDITSPHQAVLILGKFQYVRSRFLQMHSAEIEGTLTNASQVLLPSLDGKNFDTAVLPYIDHSDSTLLSCSYRADAKNHSLVIKGQFAVESVELLFTPTSDR